MSCGGGGSGCDYRPTNTYDNDYQNGKERNLAIELQLGCDGKPMISRQIGRYYIRPAIKFAAVQTFEFLITLLRSLLKATFNALESCPPSEVDFHLFENCFPTKPGLCCCSAIEMPFTRPERNPVCNSGAHHCYYLPTKL